MCGICGLIWRQAPSDSEEIGKYVIEKMMEPMRHRGPDGSGLHITPNVALGHLRLSIIDIEGGTQPMHAAGEQVTIVYNGEVYNFPELRADLIAKGWHPATRSDTETILARYIDEGAGFDDKFNGMYAYAIYDRREGAEIITLGVDPTGIKPLYLYENDRVILFASELRGIEAGLRALNEPLNVNEAALAAYLALGWAPAPSSLQQNVRKLGPGERVRIENGKIRPLSRREIQSVPFSGNSQDLVNRIETTLTAAVQRQMISDAPLGFFLSGGIDSSLLVALGTKLGASIKTFSVGFSGDGHGAAAANEADIARAVATHFGTEHHEHMIDAAVLKSRLDEVLVAMDEPIADPACLPLLLISEFARQHVKVCLSGDGGDELFAGYPRHWLSIWKKRWQQSPQIAQGLLRTLFEIFPRSPGSGMKENFRKARVAFSLVDNPNYVAGPFSSAAAQFLTEPLSFRQQPLAFYGDGPAMMLEDMEGQLTGQMLPKTDRMTMWTSLEARVPLLDNEMIALAKQLPLSMKLDKRMGKLPLRALLSRYLPDEITQRPKQGFRVPMTSWFREDLAAPIRERLLDQANGFGPFLPSHQVEKLVQEHLDGKAEWSSQIWSLLALQSWLARNDLRL